MTVQFPPPRTDDDVAPQSPDGAETDRPGTDDASTSSEPRSRRAALAVLGGLTAVLVAGAMVASRDGGTPPPKPDIPLDAWAPYWALDDSLPEASLRLGSMREVSPFWFNATGVTTIEVDPNAPPAATEEFLRAARRADVAVVPSIVDALPAGGMAAILADPVTRAAHVDALVDFAAEGVYDGLDLDYEQFAFADGRSTWASTRPNWVAFVEELGAALRTDGRTLTVSIPPVNDAGRGANSGYWVYDHGAIAPHVDRIRVMAYDFSVAEPGPIAPLDYVERSIEGVLDATGAPEKVVLGVPVYGRNWPVSVDGTCPPSADVPGVVSVNARTVDDLIARRGATPVFDEATGESSFTYELEFDDGTTSCAQTRQVHYVDARGVALRMDLARRYGLDGTSLWAYGFEDDDVWDAILPTVADPQDSTPADPAGS